jgi:hypothetical protein
MSQTIDISGLSPEAVQAVETLVDLLRTNDLRRIAKPSQGAATASEKPSGQLTNQEWLSKWRVWTTSHQPSGIVIDDSRESIYEGR